MMMRLTAYLLSAATMALVGPALAQTAPPTDNTSKPQDVQTPSEMTANGDVNAQTPGATDAETTQSPRSSTARGANAGDVIVTANRRAERLSNVPIAVSAVSQESLQNSGATDIRQLSQLAPSLLISSTGSEANASARIRGIGTVGDNPGLESSVAVFIDGVYRSRTGSGLNDLGEVDRIEVLRGPQGTLAGRNASAGVINVLTKAPSFDFGGYGEATYGNYNAVRVAGALTGPIIKDVLAFRMDGVYSRRDGFYYDVTNKDDFNDRNRYFVRGQLLFQPTSDISLRLIGDYTRRYEKCCASVYVDTREKVDPTPGVPGDYALSPSNRIVDVMTSLGAVFPSVGDPYNRRVAITPGYNFANVTTDYGASGQLDWNFGGAALTSITAYREYKSDGAGDIDGSNLDIGNRPADGNNYRRFHTFSQELRLNGELFGDRLDWLVGGYYSHEDLQVVDNLRFGSQYGAFAACRLVATLNPAAALRNPAAAGCLSTAGNAILSGALPGTTAAFGAATPLVLGGLRTLSTLNNLGSVRDVYNQTSENYAFFTHNILKITDKLSITGGLRYTHERKDFDATFNNNNTVCQTLQRNLSPLLAQTNASLVSYTAGILTLGCTGNSTATLTGKNLSDHLSEGEFTGTGIISYKPIQQLLVYASYARGYKAGGYNLDRSDLGPAYLASTTVNPNAAALRFDPETVNAYEAGLKFTSRQFTMNVAAFRQEFKNFQLNTFNGTNYIVQNIGSCGQSLNGGDTDNSAVTGRCTGDVKYGVRSQGVELEAGFFPAPNFNVSAGYTYADTRYQHNLVGSAAGEALDPALFLLSGSQVSNAPRNVVTTSVTWTPTIGSSGMTGLAYVDGRMSSDYNTGSDLFYEKRQDGFYLVNARVGLRGKNQAWAIELWGQNLLDTNYQQVAFNAPFQGAGSLAQTQRLGVSPANQIFQSFLAEPRTYGVTVRTRF
jgi:iron complex outermembrane receptor protein